MVQSSSGQFDKTSNQGADPGTDPGAYPLPVAVGRLLEPRERLSVSHWCDRHRHLDRRFTAQPGRWRTAVVPYMREPMDAFADPGVEQLTFMKCSRVGGTEWLNNIIAWTADCRPVPTIYCQPEKPDIEDEFKGRLRALFEDSERLRAHLPEAGGEWATTTQIDLDSMSIYGAWASSHNTLIRKTAGLCVFDEIDNCEATGGPLGNTLALLIERLTTYGYRGKLILDGTPKTGEGSGWRALQASDFRRPYVPCPKCGGYQVLMFDRIEIPADVRDPDRIEIEQLGRYRCIHCEKLLEHRLHQRWMIDRTAWLPKVQTFRGRLPVNESDAESRRIVEVDSLAVPPFDPWDVQYADHVQWTPLTDGEALGTRRRGYWINVLYSPWPTRTWSHVIAKMLRCAGQPDEMQVFHNSWLAQPYEETVELTDAAKLRSRRDSEHRPRLYTPPEAKILLMGADVQAHWLYFVIRAWGVGERSWLIDHGSVETFDELYARAFLTCYPFVGPSGASGASGGLRCHALAIDTGYAERRDEVYAFARRSGVVPVKGQSHVDYAVRPSRIEWLPKGGRDPQAIVLQHVNTDLFKAKVYRHANGPPDAMGGWGLNRDATDEYIKQFTAEHQVREAVNRRKGAERRLVWKPKPGQADNHYLDCEVYAAALAYISNVAMFRGQTPAIGLVDNGDAPMRSPEANAKAGEAGRGKSQPADRVRGPSIRNVGGRGFIG